MSPPADGERRGGASGFRPVAFRDRPQRLQVALGVVAPAVIGGLAGVLLGISSGAYWVIAALAALGAFLGGFEHLGVRDGAARGLVGGVIYGIALLVVHAVAGTAAKVSLGSFPPFLVVVTAIAGMLLSAAGARIAQRQRAVGA